MGQHITGFEIQRSSTGTGGWTTIDTLTLIDPDLVRVPETGDLTGYRYVDDGLMASTTWYYRVRAMNKVGPGAWSDPGSDMTNAAEALAAIPGNLQVQGSDNQVMLYWTKPADPDGAPVTGYRIERSRDGTDLDR